MTYDEIAYAKKVIIRSYAKWSEGKSPLNP